MLGAEAHRRRLRLQRRALGDPLVHQARRRRRRAPGPRTAAAEGGELRALGRGEQGQPRQPQRGVRHGAGQQGAEMPHQAVGGRLVEEVAAVLDAALELAGRRLRQHQQEVELGGAAGALQQLDAEPGDGQAQRRVLQHQQGLEERVAARLPPRRELLDQLLEGQVLVGVGVEADFPRAVRQLAERGVAAEVETQGEGVGEEADQPLGLERGTVGDRRAHHHVAPLALAAPPRQQRAEGRQQRHERRPAPAPPEPRQGGGGAGRERAGPLAAARRCRCLRRSGRWRQGRRPVGGQLEPLGRAE